MALEAPYPRRWVGQGEHGGGVKPPDFVGRPQHATSGTSDKGNTSSLGPAGREANRLHRREEEVRRATGRRRQRLRRDLALELPFPRWKALDGRCWPDRRVHAIVSRGHSSLRNRDRARPGFREFNQERGSAKTRAASRDYSPAVTLDAFSSPRRYLAPRRLAASHTTSLSGPSASASGASTRRALKI
jgi:hypothetical protein